MEPTAEPSAAAPDPQRGAQPPQDSFGGSFWMMLIIIGTAAAILVTIQARRPKAANPYAGQPLPPLAVAGWLNTEKPLTTADLEGKLVLVDYWASWCKPCLQGLPDLIEFRKRYRDVGVVVVGFTGEDGPNLQLVKNVIDTRPGMDWPIAYGAAGTFEMMNVGGIPTYVLYDRTGKSIWGGHSLDGIEEYLVPLLAK